MRRFSAEKVKLFSGDFFDLSRGRLGPVDVLCDRAALVALPGELPPSQALRGRGSQEANRSHVVGQRVVTRWEDGKLWKRVCMAYDGTVRWNELADVCPDATCIKPTGLTLASISLRLGSARGGGLLLVPSTTHVWSPMDSYPDRRTSTGRQMLTDGFDAEMACNRHKRRCRVRP